MSAAKDMYADVVALALSEHTGRDWVARKKVGVPEVELSRAPSRQARITLFCQRCPVITEGRVYAFYYGEGPYKTGGFFGGDAKTDVFEIADKVVRRAEEYGLLDDD